MKQINVCLIWSKYLDAKIWINVFYSPREKLDALVTSNKCNNYTNTCKAATVLIDLFI